MKKPPTEPAPILPSPDDMGLPQLLAARLHGNPKKHDIPRIVRSIRRFGFNSPVVFDSTSKTLVAGHGRIEALEVIRTEGPRKGDRAFPPTGIGIGGVGQWIVPTVVREFRDDRERNAYVIADNRINEKGGWDDAALMTMSQDLPVSDITFLDMHAQISALSDGGEYLLATGAVEKPGRGKKTKRGGGRGLVYKLVVTCTDEIQQADLMAEMETRGIAVSPLIQ